MVVLKEREGGMRTSVFSRRFDLRTYTGMQIGDFLSYCTRGSGPRIRKAGLLSDFPADWKDLMLHTAVAHERITRPLSLTHSALVPKEF